MFLNHVDTDFYISMCCVPLHVYIYIYIYLYTYIYTFVYIYTHAYTRIVVAIPQYNDIQYVYLSVYPSIHPVTN